MSNWTNTLNLKDLWEARKDSNITLQKMGKIIAKRIRKLRCYKDNDFELEEIAYSFEFIEEDVDEFDDVLEQLYDWADSPLPTPEGEMQKKLCWIKTF